jgi:hypothetical protein
LTQLIRRIILQDLSEHIGILGFSSSVSPEYRCAMILGRLTKYSNNKTGFFGFFSLFYPCYHLTGLWDVVITQELFCLSSLPRRLFLRVEQCPKRTSMQKNIRAVRLQLNQLSPCEWELTLVGCSVFVLSINPSVCIETPTHYSTTLFHLLLMRLVKVSKLFWHCLARYKNVKTSWPYHPLDPTRVSRRQNHYIQWTSSAQSTRL